MSGFKDVNFIYTSSVYTHNIFAHNYTYYKRYIDDTNSGGFIDDMEFFEQVGIFSHYIILKLKHFARNVFKYSGDDAKYNFLKSDIMKPILTAFKRLSCQ